jgi:DNA invertase Pin-like site-specific DNA recombinase
VYDAFLRHDLRVDIHLRDIYFIGNIGNDTSEKLTLSGKFVSYLRVSTQQQGRSGLGLEAQKESVAGFLNGGRWKLVEEVVEVESGKRSDRPQLARALSLCRVHRATLLVANLDRLARNVAFISSLMEAGIAFQAVDLPNANNLTVHIMAAMAEYEAKAISERTKVALAAAKARGTKLGFHSWRGDGKRWEVKTVASKGNSESAKVRAEHASKRKCDLLPIIDAIRAQGAMSLR